MSDFDKEAEREKLREKYERDKAEREATQRMSDLLLKGATMTNSHCGTCGDPLFQQDGTTFCPSCHGNPDAVQGTELEAEPADGAATERAAGEDPAADRNGESDERDAAGEPDADDSARRNRMRTHGSERPREQLDPDRGADVSDRAEPTDEPTTETVEPTQPRQPATAAPSHQPSTPDRRSSSRVDAAGSDAPAGTGTGTGTPRRSTDGDSELEAARESLRRALEKFAGEAAATDDPRYATACLEAAREASETLSTLR
ncbi:Sjogren's syndrome/scleroderma autoantigen 1 family protein [Natrialba aegyptia]|nr:Sjogren's syndrome/scleroderma autoantigen 1 family protein [Natrialba aegyptia]